ncbi:MAG: hypothetical protein K2N12_08400 [Helicobacter sp.]|nr:hypothetical protein [Helicobacter sp.]
MKSLKTLAIMPLLGYLFAADIPWLIAYPTLGLGVQESAQWAGNDKQRSTQTYYDLGADFLIKRDFKLHVSLAGSYANETQVYPNSHPTTPETMEFAREGQTRDNWNEVKLSVGYNLLGLMGANDHLLFLNVGYTFRNLEKNWEYRRIQWDYDLISIELEGQKDLQGLFGTSAALLYGARYKIPTDGEQGYSGLGYDVKGWETELYIGAAKTLNNYIDFFAKITLGKSRFDETLQYTPAAKTKSHYGALQIGLRGNPFHYLK